MQVKSRLHVALLCAVFQVVSSGRIAYAESERIVCLPTNKSTEFDFVDLYSAENNDIIIEYDNAIGNWGKIRFFNVTQNFELPISNGEELYKNVKAEKAYFRTVKLKSLKTTLLGLLTLANGVTVKDSIIFTGRLCWWPFRGELQIAGPRGVSKEFTSLTPKRSFFTSRNIECEIAHGFFRIRLAFEDATSISYRTPQGGLLLTFAGNNCIVLTNNPEDIRPGVIVPNVVMIPTSDVLAAYSKMAEGEKPPQAAIAEVERKAASMLSRPTGMR